MIPDSPGSVCDAVAPLAAAIPVKGLNSTTRERIAKIAIAIFFWCGFGFLGLFDTIPFLITKRGKYDFPSCPVESGYLYYSVVILKTEVFAQRLGSGYLSRQALPFFCSGENLFLKT